MEQRITIRLSSEERNTLETLAQTKGFKSISDLSKHLMEKGLQALELSKPDYYLLANTNQSVLLLREILAIISSDAGDSNRVIDEVKQDATNWVDKFSKKIGSSEFLKT